LGFGFNLNLLFDVFRKFVFGGSLNSSNSSITYSSSSSTTISFVSTISTTSDSLADYSSSYLTKVSINS